MHPRPLSRRAPLSALLGPMLALVGLVLALAPAGAVAEPPDPAPTAADRFLDVRLAERAQAAVTGTGTGIAARSPRTADRVRDARAALTGALGGQAVLDTDPLTGTVRQLMRLDGALSAPTGAAPAATARAFARDHATALGLDARDVDALTVGGEEHSTSGLTVVRFAQQVAGIPSFDNGLRVAVDHAGRVISVAGAPRSDLPPDVPATPALSAAEALQRLMDQAGAHRAVTVTSTEQDARRTTRFSTGDVARLTLFGARTVHLAWHLSYAATSTRWYDAVVDATTGEVLYRANLVKFADTANVYRNYPGPAAAGGTGTPVNLVAPGYLASGATTLSGPNVHAWADVNDDDLAGADEEVVPNVYPGLTDNQASGGCDLTHLCAWSHLTPASWMPHKDQNVTQTFWYANNFHDHLLSAPIGFNAASGNFQDSDPLNLNALDGADTTPAHGPDADHLNNANMSTPADGQSPKMQMYLFAHTTATAAPNFRDINGGDDAAVLYHEYTHGLSSRLVTGDDGTQALNGPQAGAMGEAWSDWYAQDYLVRQGLQIDTPFIDGEIDMGRYADSVPHSIRHQAVDCPVGSTNATACPGNARTPAGGYTYGDFGKVADGPEIHADGEIWAQTLWQLREALVAKFASDAVGSDAAERMITDAMRLSVPEPSFLDMRNAILAADRNAYGGANRPIIWEAFRSRGMGFYAAADGSIDTVEDFSAPPLAGAPTGSITGAATDRDTGAPLPGVTVGIGGLATDPSFETYLASTTDAVGRYAIANVPPGTYAKVGFRSTAGYDQVIKPATVAAGQATTLDADLRRDWAATAGGARIASTNDDTGRPFGCGVAALIDQSQGTGWSAENHNADPDPSKRRVPTATVELPRAVDVSEFAIDPTNTCGNGPAASVKGYRLETSPDGTTWTTSAEGEFTAADHHHLNAVAPAAGTTASVRFVRLALRSALNEAPGGSGSQYIDVSELEVYGAPSPGAGGPAPAPAAPAPAPSPPPSIGRVRARPTFAVPATGRKGRVRVRVTCRDACRFGATLTVDRATKRRYRLRSTTVGRLSTRTVNGTKTLTVTLSADVRRRLRSRHVTRLHVTVRLTATVHAAAGGPATGATTTTKAKTVSLRL